MPICDYCHAPISESAHPYTLKLELYPAVEPSLEIDEKDLHGDIPKEMQRLIELMEAMDDNEVEKQEKLIYVTHQFILCHGCRNKIARQLKTLLPPDKEIG